MQIKLIFTTKVSHLATFWEWDFLELGNGLFDQVYMIGGVTHRMLPHLSGVPRRHVNRSLVPA